MLGSPPNCLSGIWPDNHHIWIQSFQNVQVLLNLQDERSARPLARPFSSRWISKTWGFGLTASVDEGQMVVDPVIARYHPHHQPLWIWSRQRKATVKPNANAHRDREENWALLKAQTAQRDAVHPEYLGPGTHFSVHLYNALLFLSVLHSTQAAGFGPVQYEAKLINDE